MLFDATATIPHHKTLLPNKCYAHEMKLPI
jgi:hypothetical protein